MIQRVITVAITSIALLVPVSAQAAVTIIATPTATTVTLTQKTITLVPPTSNSPGAWSIEFDNPKIATASGLNLTLLSAGTSIIRYVQAASGAYNAAHRSSRLLAQVLRQQLSYQRLVHRLILGCSLCDEKESALRVRFQVRDR